MCFQVEGGWGAAWIQCRGPGAPFQKLSETLRKRNGFGGKAKIPDKDVKIGKMKGRDFNWEKLASAIEGHIGKL